MIHFALALWAQVNLPGPDGDGVPAPAPPENWYDTILNRGVLWLVLMGIVGLV